ncbi:ABC transporter substrate-binding protein [Ornithinimicrobium sp. Arc0846-15]|nr:ABC transporter substrate-binding protein [Ornithinimicrobium laminariae]
MALQNRGRASMATAAVASLMFLAACGSDDSSDSGEAADSSADAGAAATVTITDSQGRDVEIPTNPEVVVATDWTAIRTLNDLGIEVDATPAANAGLPEDLAMYEGDDIPVVGDVFEPDYEAIAAMEPDLVVVGSRSGTPEVVAEFERFAPAVIDMSVRTEDPAEFVPDTRERVEQFGEIFGLKAEADELMTGVEDQIEALNAEITESGDNAMFVQVSDGSVGAYGPGSRFGLVYSVFGYEPTDAPVDDEGSHGQEISQEFFVEYNPDALLVLDRAKTIGEDQTPALDILTDGLADSTNAAQDDRMVEVDGFSWYLAANAPSSLQAMIDDVVASQG